MHLRPEDVQDIVRLLDSLPYDEFDVETSGLRVSLRRAGSEGWTQESRVLSSPNVVGADLAEAIGDQPVQPNGSEQAIVGETTRGHTADDPARSGLLGVNAPLPGTFYRAPKPGAEPYVDVGSRVEEDTVVGLIETMKLFNSVYANVRGVVAEFLVDDAEFADKDATLVLIEPDET